MSGCIPITWGATAMSAIDLLPWIVGLFLFAGAFVKTPQGKWGKQWLLVAFQFYIYPWIYFLYLLQTTFQVTRAHPFCLGLMTYTFPSSSAFYLGLGVSFLVGVSIAWRINLSWMYWVSAFLVTVGVPFYLVWLNYNLWWEILISMALGIFAAVSFVLTVRLYLIDDLPYLLNVAPWTWFHCYDTWILTPEQHKETLRIKTCREQIYRAKAVRV